MVPHVRGSGGDVEWDGEERYGGNGESRSNRSLHRAAAARADHALCADWGFKMVWGGRGHGYATAGNMRVAVPAELAGRAFASGFGAAVARRAVAGFRYGFDGETSCLAGERVGGCHSA